jgi:hypothetical protein
VEAIAAPPAPFVVGVARSGTTLLRLMLDAHRDLAIPPETHFIPAIAEACGGPATKPAGRESPACFLAAITGTAHWPDFGVDSDALKRQVAACAPFTLGAGLRAFYRLYAARFGKPRWGDKTPRYLVSLPLIQQVLPEARFVHLIRDGRDVWLSQRAVSFGPDTIETAAAAWASRIARARTLARDLPFYLEIRYEDLVGDPELALRQVCAYIDLPWDPGMLDYHARAADRLAELQDVVHSATGRVRSSADRQRLHAATTAPPQADRVGRWRSEMGAAERARFQAIAGPTLRELGYDLD